MHLATRSFLLVSPLAMALLWAGPAHAGGFATARYGGEHGNVTTEHPTAIYFNPAGLALGSGWRIYAEGVVAWRTAEYDRPADAINNPLEDGEAGTGTPQGAIAANSGTATLSNVVAAPFLGVVTDLGVPNLGLGLALYAPFGGQAEWDKNDDFADDATYPGAADGVQRWSTISGELRSVYITLGGAYRIPGPRLSFGIGLNVISSSINTVRARTVQGNDDMTNAAGDIVEGRSLIDVTGLHLGAGAGVIWEPTDGLWIGASYQSQPGFGKMTEGGTLTNKFGATATDASKIDLEQELPDITRLGARYQPMPQVELRLSGEYQRWSVFKNQCLIDADDDMQNCHLDDQGGALPDAEGLIVNIPRRWNDSWGVRAGASYWVMPALELNGGLNFDTSAVPDETIDASLLDQDKLIAIAGLRYTTMGEQLILGLTINNVFYFERTVAPRQRDENGVQIGPPSPSGVPDGAGTYRQNVFFVNLGAGYQF